MEILTKLPLWRDAAYGINLTSTTVYIAVEPAQIPNYNNIPQNNRENPIPGDSDVLCENNRDDRFSRLIAHNF